MTEHQDKAMGQVLFKLDHTQGWGSECLVVKGLTFNELMSGSKSVGIARSTVWHVLYLGNFD